jgi:hypothetical protein
MRWNGSSELKLDVAWRKELSLVQKLTIDAGTIPGRYPFVKLNVRDWQKPRAILSSDE